MKTTKGQDLKKEIISKLKLKASDLSVKYDGSYQITIKSWFPASKIEAIAKKNEHIDRCEFSGEILCGGNTFVFVNYDYNLKLTEELIEKIEALPIINFGNGFTSDSVKYHHYSRYLQKALGEEWTDSDAGSVLTADYELCKKIYSRA